MHTVYYKQFNFLTRALQLSGRKKIFYKTTIHGLTDLELRASNCVI